MEHNFGDNIDFFKNQVDMRMTQMYDPLFKERWSYLHHESEQVPDDKNGERMMLKVPRGASLETMMSLINEALSKVGVEIHQVSGPNVKESYDSYNTLGFGPMGHQTQNPYYSKPKQQKTSEEVVFEITKLSDAMFHRKLHEVLESSKDKREAESVASLKLHREQSMKKEKEEEKRRKREERKKKKDEEVIRILREAKEKKENEEPTYDEKIEWFCEKYGENYEIIYGAFADDDLDNLMWKGERIKFPKKRKDL